MQVNISTRHGQLSEATRAKLASKAEKLDRFFERLMSIELVVDLKDEQNPQVEVIVSAEHKHDFVANAQSESLSSAIDSALQKVEQQLRKYKERVQQKHRNPQQRRQETIVEYPSSEE